MTNATTKALRFITIAAISFGAAACAADIDEPLDLDDVDQTSDALVIDDGTLEVTVAHADALDAPREFLGADPTAAEGEALDAEREYIEPEPAQAESDADLRRDGVAELVDAELGAELQDPGLDLPGGTLR